MDILRLLSETCSVDPLLYHVLHPVTMEVLIEALTRSVSFQSHLDVNLLGQDTNNLVSKAANELLDGSPLNLPALLDTLRSIKAEHVSNISSKVLPFDLFGEITVVP